jgi:hypothetical protein
MHRRQYGWPQSQENSPNIAHGAAGERMCRGLQCSYSIGRVADIQPRQMWGAPSCSALLSIGRNCHENEKATAAAISPGAPLGHIHDLRHHRAIMSIHSRIFRRRLLCGTVRHSGSRMLRHNIQPARRCRMSRFLAMATVAWLGMFVVAPATYAGSQFAPSTSSDPTSPTSAASDFSAASAACETSTVQRSTVNGVGDAAKVKTLLGYRLMPGRYEGVCLVLVGYDASGQPLVGLQNGHFFGPDYGDDQGILWLVPPLIRTFHLTLDEGIDLFFGAALASSLFLGLLGFFLLFRDVVSRLIAVVGLGALYLGAWKVGDVYAFYVVSTVAVIPLFLSFCRRPAPSVGLALFLFCAGGIIGTSEIVRTHSGTATLIFLVFVLLAGERLAGRWRLPFCVVLLLGIAVPYLAYEHAFVQRSEFLSRRGPAKALTQKGHVLWHSVYIGLGFLQNPYVPAYLDEVGIAKVHSIDPSLAPFTPEYEMILRREVFRLARAHPNFLLTTLAAKAGVVLAYLLICANIGLLAAFLYPKGCVVECAFWLAMGFNSLFGLAVVPKVVYLLGLMSFAVLYGIFSIGHALGEDG